MPETTDIPLTRKKVAILSFALGVLIASDLIDHKEAFMLALKLNEPDWEP